MRIEVPGLRRMRTKEIYQDALCTIWDDDCGTSTVWDDGCDMNSI